MQGVESALEFSFSTSESGILICVSWHFVVVVRCCSYCHAVTPEFSES